MVPKISMNQVPCKWCIASQASKHSSKWRRGSCPPQILDWQKIFFLSSKNTKNYKQFWESVRAKLIFLAPTHFLSEMHRCLLKNCNLQPHSPIFCNARRQWLADRSRAVNAYGSCVSQWINRCLPHQQWYSQICELRAFHTFPLFPVDSLLPASFSSFPSFPLSPFPSHPLL